MQPAQFPGRLRELEFVDAYCRTAVRKPQMGADAALRALVFSDAGDRAILVGLIAQELAESCRRLVAVYNALADRRYSIARSLMRPLPGAAEWRTFIHEAGTCSPEQICRELSLGDDAMDFATQLRGDPHLADLTNLVVAAESDSAMLLVPLPEGRYVPTECWIAAAVEDGEPVAASVSATEQEAANLADMTASMCSIARGFLGVYLGNRRSAGRRD
jgi:hypothetical protein